MTGEPIFRERFGNIKERTDEDGGETEKAVRQRPRWVTTGHLGSLGPAVTKYRDLGGRGHRGLMFSKFWRPEVQDQRLSRVALLLEAPLASGTLLAHGQVAWNAAGDPGPNTPSLPLLRCQGSGVRIPHHLLDPANVLAKVLPLSDALPFLSPSLPLHLSVSAPARGRLFLSHPSASSFVSVSVPPLPDSALCLCLCLCLCVGLPLCRCVPGSFRRAGCRIHSRDGDKTPDLTEILFQLRRGKSARQRINSTNKPAVR